MHLQTFTSSLESFLLPPKSQLRLRQTHPDEPPTSVHQATDSKTEPNQDSTNATPILYSPPKAGLLSYLPASWVPYAELIRFQKPAGSVYLYLPYLWGTLLAATISSRAVLPSELLATNAFLFAGSVIIRGGACAWNDLLDRDFDRQVQRTRLRPIARGAISPKAALACIASHAIVGCVMLAWMPAAMLLYSIPFFLGTGSYPLMKRITDYPQVFLGFVYGYGAIMAFPALGLGFTAQSLMAATCLYLSGVCWTVLGDWIYACQDAKDDIKAGVKSIAVKHAANAKTSLIGLAFVQAAFLFLTGFVIDASLIFYLTPLTTFLATMVMVKRVNLNDPQNCGWWFNNAWWFLGPTAASGLVGDYIMQL